MRLFFSFRGYRSTVRFALLSIFLAVAHPGLAEMLELDGRVHTAVSLSSAKVAVAGRSELHLTGKADPLKNSEISLNSADAWVFHECRPSVVADTYLKSIRVHGERVVIGKNVRATGNVQ